MTKRGRKPLPTAIKIDQGEKKNRINFNEPKFRREKDSTPPDYLDEMAVEEWNRVFPELTSKKVLAKVDRMVLAGYCNAYANWRKAQKVLNEKGTVFKTPNGSIQQLPHVSMVRNWMSVMLKFAAELGMTPSSRSRIEAEDPKAKGNDNLIRALMGNDAPKEVKRR